MIGADPYAARRYQVLKLEVHLHTRHSDGQHSVTEMLGACRTAGYDAVAVTRSSVGRPPALAMGRNAAPLEVAEILQ